MGRITVGVDVGKRRNHGEGVLRTQVHLRVPGAEVLCYAAGKGRLVHVRVIEPDRERVDVAPAHLLHERDDERRVDAARQKRADRNVGGRP